MTEGSMYLNSIDCDPRNPVIQSKSTYYVTTPYATGHIALTEETDF